MGDCIDDIEDNKDYVYWIGESKGDCKEDGEDDILETIDGEKHQRREKKLLGTLSCAKNEAEAGNQSEDCDKKANIGKWVAQVNEICNVLSIDVNVELLIASHQDINWPSILAHVVLHNLLHIRLDLEETANLA